MQGIAITGQLDTVVCSSGCFLPFLFLHLNYYQISTVTCPDHPGLSSFLLAFPPLRIYQKIQHSVWFLWVYANWWIKIFQFQNRFELCPLINTCELSAFAFEYNPILWKEYEETEKELDTLSVQHTFHKKLSVLCVWNLLDIVMNLRFLVWLKYSMFWYLMEFLILLFNLTYQNISKFCMSIKRIL